jgi:hypothetical protein
MARRVFFSFQYQRDLWRVNVVRNSAMIDGVAAAAFTTHRYGRKRRRRARPLLQSSSILDLQEAV